MKKFTFLFILAAIVINTACGNKTNKEAELKHTNTEDSLALVDTTKAILKICSSVDWLDDKVTELGMFYKAGPYLAYRGPDENRKWKDTCNYRNEAEKKYVDNFCYDLNRAINQGPEPTFGKFSTETESEGTWYIIELIVERNGEKRSAIFAYLKIHGNFVLGDID